MIEPKIEVMRGTGDLPPVQLERLDLNDIHSGVLAELKDLYAHAYHDTHMFKDLVEDMTKQPEVFQLFLARLPDQSNQLVGARAVESKCHPFIDYLGFKPMHGKRFSVLPGFRSQGIGKQLVDAGKHYCFEELGLQAIFGESNELGALAMYGREGAMYQLDSIKGALSRNTPEQNIEFFREFINNPKLRGLRYPVGEGIQFVYPRDETIVEFFREHGYVLMTELINID